MIKASQGIAVSSQDIKVFCTPAEYKQQLLTLIQAARSRIYITALYLQDDDAGREILHALYRAKAGNPSLNVKVFVDCHRAQRGLIGEGKQEGNRALYLALEKEYRQSIDVFGVAVKRKELFGVLHLKGMVFDDTVFYTGASINDVYLHQQEKYRLDRYYQISSKSLSDSFCFYLDRQFVQSGLVPRLNDEVLPGPGEQKQNIRQLKARMKKSRYELQNTPAKVNGVDDILIKPYIGYGSRGNRLNHTIRQLVQKSRQELLLFTPYFNLPKSLAKDVTRALKRKVKVTLVVGDKKANDFYIADEKDFSTIGIVPYIYEMLLHRFVKKWQKYIDSGQLEIRLWQDEGNSFHLKGLIADNRYHMLTGSNLNPRAWSLDLENGLLLDDKQGHLQAQVQQEVDVILKHTRRIGHSRDIEAIDNYPDKPKALLKKIRMTQIDRLLKRFL
ncbi:CDP-diacylglycerol--serine O-phosphatidyltransferase [Thalassomonas actiniarum]|uniref:CDP-diacylglycerol--serine O-phosphatidyltransferase n=1 Tax=Thalassomonas actiniarum TaxID=485447 RepID=UPI0005CF1BCE|nr:CDP-diacylglycerol--serine O-phosphatidyltransferase [Thalassomonas actiniarum]